MSNAAVIALRKLHDELGTLLRGPHQFSADELKSVQRKFSKRRAEIRRTTPVGDPVWRSLTAKSLVLVAGDPLTDDRPYELNASVVEQLRRQLQSDIEKAERGNVS